MNLCKLLHEGAQFTPYSSALVRRSALSILTVNRITYSVDFFPAKQSHYEDYALSFTVGHAAVRPAGGVAARSPRSNAALLPRALPA